METKYITFSPYHSGLSNVIMSYELAFSIAHITNRSIVLPPKVFIDKISKSHNIKDFVDIWEIFDIDKIKKYFNIIDYYEVPEFQGKYDQLKNDISYSYNISSTISDVLEIKFNRSITDSHEVLINEYDYNEDFEDFCQKRNVIILADKKNKFIHFENNLFGHYWYHVYPGNFEKRNELKKIINDCFTYKNKFCKLSNKVKENIGEYNALHVRRGDFLFAYQNETKSVSTKKKLLNAVKLFFDNSLPLYISTDEVDKSFFSEIEKKYKIYFYDDFDYQLNDIEHTIIEQIICSKAKKFYGTFLSTYTKRINIMRGLNGKQCDDEVGINNQDPQKIDLSIPNPWKLKEVPRWNWIDSSHPQWKSEIGRSYVDTFKLSQRP